MLTAFRKFAKSKWAIGLLVLLALGLLVTGGSQIGDVFSSFGPKHVVSAGSRSIDAPTFKADLDRRRDQAQQQAGRPLEYEELIANGALAAYLGQEAQKLGFMSWADSAGIRPANELVLRQIRKIPAFFDSVTGQFNEAQYNEVLQNNNTTAEVVEREFRDEIVTRHYGSAVGAGLRLPRIYGAVMANQAKETRDARWFLVTQAMAGTAGAPTDAQLTAFIQQNATQLRLPEFRKATVVLFDSPTDGQGEVSDARIEERFNFRRDALSQPETRSFVTLTAPTKAVADRIAAALRAGQTPEAVAQANNIQPTAVTDRPRSAVADPAVAAAVFGLTENQVSDAIQARVGFVVAKLSSIKPGRAVTLNDVRAQIIDELRAEDVRAAVYARVTAYDKARQDGKTLDAAVAEIGARTLALPPITRDGRSMEQPNFRAPPQVLEAMWKLGARGESEVIQVGQGEYIVVRVDEVIAAALPSLDNPRFRSELATGWTARENARLLTTRANALAARVRGGEDIAAVARSANATLETGTGISAQDQTRGQGLIGGLFTAARGQVFSQQQTADSFVIGRNDRITPPNATLAAGDAEQFRARLAGDLLNSLGETAIKSAAARVEAEFSEPRARVALGLPEVAPAAPATGAPAVAPAQ
ncbi:MAG: rotamase [Brevundimonas sp.]|nr:MAG: rotamase [Brevundimonas sp.]